MSRMVTLVVFLAFSLSHHSSYAQDKPNGHCVNCTHDCTTHCSKQSDDSRNQVQLHVMIAEVESCKVHGRYSEGTRCCADAKGFCGIADQFIKRSGLNNPSDQTVVLATTEHTEELCEVIATLGARGYAQCIATPCLITSSGQRACLKIGGEFPIIIPLGNAPIVQARECGIRLDCVPTIVGDDQLRLEFRAEVETPDFANGVSVRGWTIPGIHTQRCDCVFNLKSGQSVVLGGLESSSDAVSARVLTNLSNWLNAELRCSTSCAAGLPICTLPGSAVTEAANAFACTVTQPKELVIIVTAKCCESAASYDDSESKVVRLIVADDEADSDEPHRPAILLTPSNTAVEADVIASRECDRFDCIRSNPAAGVRSGCAVTSDAGLAGRIVCTNPSNQERCSVLPNGVTKCSPGSCCRAGLGCAEDDCDDDDDDDDEDDPYGPGQIESFIHQVLQAQMQYLENMMESRLEYERQLLELKAGTESALARQRLEHGEEVLKLKTEHVQEIQKMKELMWAAECKAMVAQHQATLEHERELFTLRQQHSDELQSQRIALLEAEIRALRGRADASEPERVARTPDHFQQSSAVRPLPHAEVTVHVEDLASGRVRYAPLPPKPDIVLYQPHDVVERIEFSTPPIAAGQSVWQELECLRNEIRRLRAVVDDMLCTTPDFLPSPVPQIPLSDCDN